MELRERFWIFLIRWRWLLTYLDMLLFVAIGLGNGCYRFNATNWDLLSCLIVSGRLMRYFGLDMLCRKLENHLFLFFLSCFFCCQVCVINLVIHVYHGSYGNHGMPVYNFNIDSLV